MAKLYAVVELISIATRMILYVPIKADDHTQIIKLETLMATL